MSYIDLRDIIAEKDKEPETYAAWEEALSTYGGIEQLASNGRSMISEDEFEDYARELAEDTGLVGRDLSWPRIDWEQAADDLKIDYQEVEVEGTTYWFRS